MRFKKIICLVSIIFVVNIFVFTSKNQSELCHQDQFAKHHWSLYYLDGCHGENVYVKAKIKTFIFTEKDNLKVITGKNGEKIGYWSKYVDELGYEILFVDFFDTIQAKFYFIDDSFILEGRGKIINYCENDITKLYNFTKFLLVRR
jgi:hypothetical protein